MKVRIIGIDFGTSNSALGYRDFTKDENGNLVAESEPQLFSANAYKTIPTLVCERDNYGDVFADECPNVDSDDFKFVSSNFKMDFLEKVKLQEDVHEFIQSNSETIDALRLTKKFFKFLYESYRNINKTSESVLATEYEIRTIVTCPVRTTETQKKALVCVAELAGFKNVSTLDEATTVMRYALGKPNSELRKILMSLPEDSHLKILIVDMGAGTTDMVLYDYCASKSFSSSNLSELGCWPLVGTDKSLGGREIDAIILDYFASAGFVDVLDEQQNEALGAAKKAKEEYFSPTLLQNGTINKLSALADFSDGAERSFKRAQDAWLTRNEFDGIINDFAIQFIVAVKELLMSAKIAVREEDIDFVIVSGGGSKWYFVQDIILHGKVFGGKHLSFTKVACRNKGGLIAATEPQLMDLYGILYPVADINLVPISWMALQVVLTIDSVPIVNGEWVKNPSFAKRLRTITMPLIDTHQELPFKIDNEEIKCGDILVESDHRIWVSTFLYGRGAGESEWTVIGKSGIISQRSLSRTLDNWWNGKSEKSCGVKLKKSICVDENRRVTLSVWFDVDGYWTYSVVVRV